MTKDELKIFNLEIKIDAKINKAKRIVNEAYNYLEDDFTSIDKEEILEELDEAEYALKTASNLVDKLTEIYENSENKNS